MIKQLHNNTVQINRSYGCTVFTWLNAVAFISLVPKMDAATIQN